MAMAAFESQYIAIPDEHLLKFYGIKDVKTLWEAIKTRFGCNKESKKMQKTILKKQYENFTASRSEGLDKTYDRFQKLISQLEIHGEVISREDANLKLLRSLPPAWNTNTLMSMDNLYNNLKVYEAKIKGQSSLSLNSQNGQAFASTYADDVMFSFSSNQSNSPHYQAKEGPIDFALMAFSSSGSSSSDTEVRDNSITELKHQLEESLKEKKDDSVFKSVISETVTSVLETETSASKTSKKSIENPKTVRSSAPIIEDWESDSDDDCRIRLSIKQNKPSHAKINFVKLDTRKSVIEQYIKKLEWNDDSETRGMTTGQKKVRPVWNNAQRVKHQNFSNNLTHPHPRRNFVPTAVITNSGKVLVNAAKQSSQRAATSTSTANNTAATRPTMNGTKPSSNVFHKSHSPVRSTLIKEKVIHNILYKIKGFLTVDALGIRRETSPSLQIIKRLVVDLLHLDEVLKENRVLVTKPHNKTPYELLIGISPTLDFMRPFRCPITILNTLDHLGKFEGNADEGFLVGYSINREAFRVFNTRTKKVEENLHIKFLENKSNVTGSGPEWLIDIDSLTISMNYEPVTAGNQTNNDVVLRAQMIRMPMRHQENEMNVEAGAEAGTNNLELSIVTPVDLPNGKRAIGTKWVFRNKKDERGIVVRNKARLVAQDYTQEEGIDYDEKDDGIFISQDKYMDDILKKFDFTTVKTTSTPTEPNKTLIKDAEAEDVDVHLYRLMIGSLMYLTASRPDIMFVVCACAMFQVTPKTSHLYAVKRIFRYLKGQPKLDLWYPRDSPFDLEAFSNSNYAGDSLDKKSSTGGCQFLGKRLISWQCKKQTIVANSTTKAEYVAAASCCEQVLWIQNQMIDYGFNFMNTKIYIDNETFTNLT
nr:ribonuclease H-like domain, reverse transcriptase, RNA-dependent DNA polymerase [Tanacetum cinerariifolium]